MARSVNENLHPSGEPESGGRGPTRARRFAILELLLNSDTTAIEFEAIRIKFPKASPALLQADLKILLEMGFVEKAGRGSYRLNQPIADRVFANTIYGDRQRRQPKVKKLIAEACVKFKRPDVDTPFLGGKHCLITQGTSTTPLFTALRFAAPEQRPERVITNSLSGILELLDFPNIPLSIVGGRPDLNCGAIKPVRLMPAGKDGTTRDGSADTKGGDRRARDVADWLGSAEFNLVVLSCSFISPDGSIYCGDEMVEFRRSILGVADVAIAILADRTKLEGVPVGVPVKFNLKDNRTWLFVDRNPANQKSERYKAFEDVLGDRFVTVDVGNAGETGPM